MYLVHNYRGDHELTIHKNAASDLLGFEKRAHGNMMPLWYFDNLSITQLPTSYLGLNQVAHSNKNCFPFDCN